MALDLKALLATARVEARLNSPKRALDARLSQRQAAEEAAARIARSVEKRRSLESALCSDSMDAMRFRWMGEHVGFWESFRGQTLDDLRRECDDAIKREAIRHLSELRRLKEA